MFKSFNKFVYENLDYPITKINIMLDKMTPNLKFKILDLTEEKSDIQLALYELSKNPNLFNKIWNEFKNKLYFMHQENLITNYNLFKESIFVSEDEINNMIDNKEYKPKRLELLKTNDEPIKDIIREMGDITIKINKINKKMDAESKEGNDPFYLMADWSKLNKEINKLEKEIESYGIQLGDEKLNKLMKEIRPDAYHPAFID